MTILAAACPTEVFATAQVQGPRVASNLTVYTPQSFVVNFTLARTGSTPANMQVYFYLVDTASPSNHPTPFAVSQTYTTPGNYAATVTLPDDCYVPAGSGWEIFAQEKTQTDSGTYSYSNVFSIYEHPPVLAFYTPMGSENLVVSRSSAATVDATDLDTSDTVYYRIYPENTGCATATNCTYNATLDGQTLPNNYALPDLARGSYATGAVQSLGKLAAGTHSLTVYVTSSNATTVSIQQNFTVVNAAQIAVEQPAGTPLADGSANVVFDPALPGASTTLAFTVKNTGAKTLTLGTISVDGNNSADFALASSPSSTLAPAATTSFTVRFMPSATGVRLAALHIASNVVGSTNPFDINLSGRGLTPSESWRLKYFGSINNSGPGADLAIAAGDGLPNLIKYALNLNPLVASASPVTEDTSTGYLRLTVPRNPNATDVNFAIQVADGPGADAGWTNDVTTVDQNTPSLLQAHDNVAVGSAKARFIRLQVTRP